MIKFGLHKKHVLPIGLDIGCHSVKMIQLAVQDEKVSVVEARKILLAIDEGNQRRQYIISQVKDALKQGNFKGKDVVMVLPNDQVNITSLRLSVDEFENIDYLMDRETSQRFGLDASRDVVNYIEAGDIRQADEIKKELILFAVHNDIIETYIDLAEQIHVQPVAIDTVPCALFRSYERLLRRQEDQEKTVVFIDVGRIYTTVVFGFGRDICFIKQIPIGGEKFDSEVASKLEVTVKEATTLRNSLQRQRDIEDEKMRDMSPSVQTHQHVDNLTRQVIVDTVGAIAEELSKEISRCLRYYTVTFRGKHVEKAYISGGESHERILLNVLNRELPVEIEPAQPMRSFDISKVNFDFSRRSLLSEWAVVVGLSLKGLADGSVIMDKSLMAASV